MDRILAELVGQVPEVEAASVVSFDGLAMASALPHDMDEDRVAAMSAALLSLGERAAEGLGRGALSQVFIEGENGTVFLISADDEAVLVAVTSKGAKTGLMLFEVRRAAAAIAEVLRVEFAYETAPVEAAPPAALVPLQVVNPGGYVEGGYVDGGYMEAYVDRTGGGLDTSDSNGSRAWS
jgi:predicted regulator of Ras-like GTPase activity (Roadblock/LC7/MglB family)